MSESIVTLFSTLWTVWKEMASAIFGVVPKVLHFCLWILGGIIILPCVFVASTLYPRWIEWGEDF